MYVVCEVCGYERKINTQECVICSLKKEVKDLREVIRGPTEWASPGYRARGGQA